MRAGLAAAGLAGVVLGLWLAGAPPAGAEGTLTGRIVTFTVLAYDDPNNPLYVGRGETVTVGAGVEFGLGPEGPQNGLDVIPVTVNIGPSRVEVSYAGNFPGQVTPAKFNGYVLSFLTDCVLFEGARIDPAGTNMPLTDADLKIDRSTLYINMQGKSYDAASHFAVDLAVLDCPLS